MTNYKSKVEHLFPIQNLKRIAIQGVFLLDILSDLKECQYLNIQGVPERITLCDIFGHPVEAVPRKVRLGFDQKIELRSVMGKVLKPGEIMKCGLEIFLKSVTKPSASLQTVKS